MYEREIETLWLQGTVALKLPACLPACLVSINAIKATEKHLQTPIKYLF